MISNNATLDGLISSTNAAINGWRFNPDGTVGPGVTGSISQGAVGTAGARMAGTGHSPTDAYDDNDSEVNSLYPDLDRYSLFAYADFDVTDDLTVFAQYLHGRTHIFQYNDPRGAFGRAADRADDLQRQPVHSGQPPGGDDRQQHRQLPAAPPRQHRGRRPDVSRRHDRAGRGDGGFMYEVPGDGFFGGWDVDGYYQYGNSLRTWKQLGLRVDRIFAAVRCGAQCQRQIVCNVSTTAGGAAGLPRAVSRSTCSAAAGGSQATPAATITWSASSPASRSTPRCSILRPVSPPSPTATPPSRRR
jgi:hypothetical protein